MQGFVDHTTLTQINPIQSGVPILKNNTIEFESGYSQAFSTGTNFTVSSFGFRQTTNSIFNVLSPQITTGFNFTVNQPLLQGFGLATNQRYHSHCKEESADHRSRLQGSGDRHH